MTQSPYEVMMPQGPFGKATDRALAEENQRQIAYLSTPQGQAETASTAARYRAVIGAREALGVHGVVLPTATAKEVVAALRGEPTRLGADLLARMVEREITQSKEA